MQFPVLIAGDINTGTQTYISEYLRIQHIIVGLIFRPADVKLLYYVNSVIYAKCNIQYYTEVELCSYVHIYTYLCKLNPWIIATEMHNIDKVH